MLSAMWLILFSFKCQANHTGFHSMFACLCLSGDFHLEENMSSRAGLMSEFSLVCSACDHTTSIKSSSCVTQRGRSFDVNRRAVYHSLETGGGYEGLSSFCTVMNMPCISKTAYYKQTDECWGKTSSNHQRWGMWPAWREWHIWCSCRLWWHLGQKGIFISNWSGFCYLCDNRRSPWLPCIVQDLPEMCFTNSMVQKLSVLPCHLPFAIFMVVLRAGRE